MLIMKKMNEDIFWNIISLLDWSQKEISKSILPCIQKLLEYEPEEICIFEDILSEKLYSLDTQKHASNYQEEDYFSVDEFLYVRCYVVAKGKEYYHKILDNPQEMPIEQTYESLLYISERAYKFKTGQEFEYIPKYIYETFSNQEGWNNQYPSIIELVK